MPDHKRQHFLPSAYLKYFSTDQKICTRSSWVWRFDGKVQRKVPVESQCFGNYFYSKAKPSETEKFFGKMEEIYCNCIDKLKSGRPLDGKDCGKLLLLMFEFHLRNAAHRNFTGLENIEAYKMRNVAFMSQLLLGKKDQVATTAEVTGYLNTYWTVEVFVPSPGGEFAASDHPSVWTRLRKPSAESKSKLHMVIMPLTPKHIAVAFDRRILQVTSKKISVDDEDFMNRLQLQNMEDCIYTDRPLLEEEITEVKLSLKDKLDLECVVTDKSWRLALLYLLPEYHFSFIRLRPPLF